MEQDVGEQKGKYYLTSFLPLLGHYFFKSKKKAIHKALNYTSLLKTVIFQHTSHSFVFKNSSSSFHRVFLKAPNPTTILREEL